MAVTPSGAAVVTSIAASVTSGAATITSVATTVAATVTPVVSIAPVAESEAEEWVAIVPGIVRPVVIGAVTVIGVCSRWLGGDIDQ